LANAAAGGKEELATEFDARIESSGCLTFEKDAHTGDEDIPPSAPCTRKS
jgi:hypothetical protein